MQRIIDNLPAVIHHELVLAITKGMEPHIFAELKLGESGTPERLAGLFAEDPAIAEERTRLGERRGRLEEMRARLDGFVV